MKYLLLVFCLSFSIFATQAQPYHENHKIFAVNKLAPHADAFPFTTQNAAIKGDKTNSQWYQSLNGLWKFNWVKKPADKPKNFQEVNYDDSAWETFPVPANWEVHGYDYPIYLDEKYPFIKSSPMIKPKSSLGPFIGFPTL